MKKIAALSLLALAFAGCKLNMLQGLNFHIVIYGLVIVAGVLISLTIWISDLIKLLRLSFESGNPYKFIVWSFLIPVLNLLWVPWALITANFCVKKTQERYVSQFLFNSGAGITILSVPLLVLYLFWGTIILITHEYILANMKNFEIVMYSSIVVICFLIVFVSYLVYFSIYVYRYNLLSIQRKKVRNRTPKPE